MPKQKPLVKQALIKSLEELKGEYDRETLIQALNSFKTHNVAWKLLQAMLIKEYQNQVIYALEYSSKSGTQSEAAYRSGCAQTLLDMATSLIDKYENELAGNSAVVQSPRPTEE